jgi:aerobic-type carbon monoxide dehydrogenase small subunit (CoxS/CutS family)
VSCSINGRPVNAELPANRLLLDFLRDDLGLTGAKRSCDVQVCGACTVLLDGRPVSACCTLAYEARGRAVTTIEGLVASDRFAGLERAFTKHASVQCGFCTPGIVLTLHARLAEGPIASDEDVRETLSGNLCRCTGYKGILEAVRAVAGVEAA